MMGKSKTIWNIGEDAIDALLPGGDPGATLVLFRDASTPAEVTRRFARAAESIEARACVANAEEAQRLVRWFGITQFPALAMICDGVLLGIEVGCDDDSCARVLELARSTLEELTRV